MGIIKSFCNPIKHSSLSITSLPQYPIIPYSLANLIKSLILCLIKLRSFVVPGIICGVATILFMFWFFALVNAFLASSKFAIPSSISQA